MSSILRTYIRQILEDVRSASGAAVPKDMRFAGTSMDGNSYKSPDGMQYTYEDTENVKIDIFPTMDGKTHVKITSLLDDSLSSPERLFSNEEEARKFARDYVEKINRIAMSKHNR